MAYVKRLVFGCVCARIDHGVPTSRTYSTTDIFITQNICYTFNFEEKNKHLYEYFRQLLL